MHTEIPLSEVLMFVGSVSQDTTIKSLMLQASMEITELREGLRSETAFRKREEEHVRVLAKYVESKGDDADTVIQDFIKVNQIEIEGE